MATADKGDNPADGAAATRADRVRRQAEEKQQRLAEALRANLRRRKSQSRERTGMAAGQTPPDDDR
jgi:hypothetical protein